MLGGFAEAGTIGPCGRISEGFLQPGAMVPGSSSSSSSSSWPPSVDALADTTILRVPVALLRFHQPMAEHGPGASAQPIGAAPPPGHCHFRSSSE